MKNTVRFLQIRKKLPQLPESVTRTHHPYKWLLLFIGTIIWITACSSAGLFGRAPATPAPTRAVAPTFTATPDFLPPLVVITPPAGDRPGIIIVPEGADPRALIPPPPSATNTPMPPPSATPTQTDTPTITPTPGPTDRPTETPIPSPTLTPTATNTPLPTDTPTPTITPTPFVVVQSGLVGLRTGPGVDYPLVAQLGPELPITVVGRNEPNTWLQICCVSGAPVWIATNSVALVNSIAEVPVVQAQPPPPPTPTPFPSPTGTPTSTPSPTPYPFGYQAGDIEFRPTSNQFLTIWIKLSISKPDGPPAEGYFVKVFFEGIERPNYLGPVRSEDTYALNRLPGAGTPREFNLKYEFHSQDLSNEGGPDRLESLGTGTWTIYVVDGAGNQISPPAIFTTEPRNPHRELWIHWVRTG